MITNRVNFAKIVLSLLIFVIPALAAGCTQNSHGSSYPIPADVNWTMNHPPGG